MIIATFSPVAQVLPEKKSIYIRLITRSSRQRV